MNYHSTGNYANEIISAGGSWNSNGTGLFKNSLDVPNQTQYGMGSQTTNCHNFGVYNTNAGVCRFGGVLVDGHEGGIFLLRGRYSR